METAIMIYLDTHVVLWLYSRKGEGLSERARWLIEYDPEILISPIVLLEVDYLHEIGRTTLGSGPVFQYLHQQIDLKACKKSFIDVIQTASQLSWTRDPFDRIITAQAMIDRNNLITKDRIILEHYEQAVW
jgi:PIN domain nuclease of toxin-antitoxin system